MKRASLPPLKETYAALEDAGLDLYGFALALHGGNALSAEPLLLDILLLGLENNWFTDWQGGRFSHREFREDFFRALWEKSSAAGRVLPARVGAEVPLGHEEMSYYQLPQLARAALFLRAKKHFSYASLALIFSRREEVLRQEVESAREFLLGRRVKAPVDLGDDF